MKMISVRLIFFKAQRWNLSRHFSENKMDLICLVFQASRERFIIEEEDVSVWSHGNQQPESQLQAALVTGRITSLVSHPHTSLHSSTAHTQIQQASVAMVTIQKRQRWQVNIRLKSILLLSHFLFLVSSYCCIASL